MKKLVATLALLLVAYWKYGIEDPGSFSLGGSLPHETENQDDSPLRESLAQIEAREAQDREKIANLSVRADLLLAQVRMITSEWETAEVEFKAAQAAYGAAVEMGSLAAQGLKSARADFEKAAERYRQVTWILILAAASDAIGSAICQSKVSTQAYRRRLLAQGVDLTDLQVDHVFARALGGVDHPLNYQLLEGTLNQSLGADVLAKFASWPLKTLQGMAVSALAALRC